jgi:hypothetical protein
MTEEAQQLSGAARAAGPAQTSARDQCRALVLRPWIASPGPRVRALLETSFCAPGLAGLTGRGSDQIYGSGTKI